MKHSHAKNLTHTTSPRLLHVFIIIITATPSEVTNVRADPDEDNIRITWQYSKTGNALPLSNFSIVIKVVNEDTTLYSETVPAESRMLTVPKSVLPMTGSFAASVNPVNVLGQGTGRDATFGKLCKLLFIM